MLEAKAVGYFAGLLGWSDPARLSHIGPSAEHVTWYECREAGPVVLHINCIPRYTIGVYSGRHRIYAGFYRVDLSGTERQLRSEARRLCHLFMKAWFDSRGLRAAYRALNREYLRHSLADMSWPARRGAT